MAQSIPARKTFGARHRNQNDTGPEGQKAPDDPWLKIAKDAFDTSTSFVDNNYRKEWEDSIRHFQSKHMRGSKYMKDEYKYRSKHFRPKTRASIRQNEAATAAAFFSQVEVMSVEAKDEQNKMQKASAALRHEILNERLAQDIPWFMICIGGMQGTNIYGIVGSKQYWDFKEAEHEVPIHGVIDAETGEPAVQKVRKRVKDRPIIDLRPIENLRFDPAADWTDVVNSSPYFIDMTPMYVGDVKEKMESGEWKKVPDNILLQARTGGEDTTRQEREGEREDSKESRHTRELSDFDTVWVHENFVRKLGKEYHFYTIGTVARLTAPRPLQEVYLHNVRPHVIGTCVIEAHRAVPESPAHMSKGLQKEANELVNTRMDNVKLALNKRYIVRRGKQVDLQSLVRNAPGSITLANDPELDVKAMEFNDVTGSSYAEQDRLNVDMDELLGSFSQGSVQSNRKLNETVGGMQLLRGSSNQMTQYLIMTFSVTWVEPVLRQLDLLEQYYEDDMEFLQLMASRAGFEKYGIDVNQLPPEFWKQLLMQPATVKVNVANSATDPAIRLQMFMDAVHSYTEIAQNAPPDLDREAVKSFIFALLGFRDGQQFSVDNEGQDPQLAAAMQQIQTLTQQLEGQYAEAKAKEESKAQIEGAKLDQKNESEHSKLMMEERLEMMHAKNAQILEQIRMEGEQRQKLIESRIDLIIANLNNRAKVEVAEIGKSATIDAAQISAAKQATE